MYKESDNPLDDLGQRIDKAKAAQEERTQEEPGSGGAGAMRIAIELMAGVGVGTAGGLWADRKFGTSPWLLLLGFFLGVAAGSMNIYKLAVTRKE